MPSSGPTAGLLALALLLLLARPARAFGSGNIASVAKIEGSNWRHGDIEDTLLTLLMSRAAGGQPFDKMSVARVYFGNWLRDYSQAIDVGTLKYVSAEAIRILLWVLSFMTFGFGTREFEVTADRLGCYRPEDHIDNPKDYADNIDATQYDPRLRGPVDERRELAVDPHTGLKNYIANERAGIVTSARHVRRLLGECIRRGRAHARSRDPAELHECLRLLGTGLHCLEDYSAHSNYVELALIEMGEPGIFPHVGRRTKMPLPGARGDVYPIVTGTFGGVDFLHSVMGGVEDKVAQSEIQELEGAMQQRAHADTSLLQDLLDKIPPGFFGGRDEAGKADDLRTNATAAQVNQVRVSPREPEEFTIQMQAIAQDIKPIMQWHDEIMGSITAAVEKIPVLPELIEQLEAQVNVFVFALIAPFVLPIINQIKNELNTGSSEVIQSSKDKQFVVFDDDDSTDPTHSMLSKDHFSNLLNEPAGKIASQILKWAVPQIIACVDDERADVDRTLDRIISGVFHHPAQRDLGSDGASDGRRLMFQVVEDWWRSQGERGQAAMREKLSRRGVQNGDNHKPGVEDTGHGCCTPLGMATASGGGKGGQNALAGRWMSGLQAALGGHAPAAAGLGSASGGHDHDFNQGIGSFASEAAGGGALGGLVGALAGGVGGSLLSGAFGGRDGDERPETTTHSQQGYRPSGEHQQTTTEYGRAGDHYAQAEYTQTQRPDGGRQTEYHRYEQNEPGRGSRLEQRREEGPGYGRGSEQTRREEYRVPGGLGGAGYQEPSRPGYGGDARGGYGEAPRQEYGGGGRSDDEPARHEYGGGGRNYGEPARHAYGGGGQGYGEPRQEFGGGGYGEPPRQQYGGNRGFDEPRQEFGGGGYGPARQEHGADRSDGYAQASQGYGQQPERRERRGSSSRNEGRKKHGHKKSRSRSTERRSKQKSDDEDSDEEKKSRRRRKSKSKDSDSDSDRGEKHRRRRSKSRDSDKERRRW